MLAVILIILKIIGIVLLSVLGLVLFLLLLVLFVPVRYRGHAVKADTIKGDVVVSWFLHLIHFHLTYDNGTIQQTIRILGISFKRKGSAKAEYSDLVETVKPKVVTDTSTRARLFQEEDHMEKNAGEKTEDRSSSDEDENHIVFLIKKIWHVICIFFRFIFSIPGRIAVFFKKVWLAICNFFSTIRRICGKICEWKRFFNDERFRGALKLLKAEIIKLLRHVRPRHLRGWITFGFEDPCTTGQVLAGVCAFYPFYYKHFTVNPVFDAQVIEGDVNFSGRAYVFILLKIFIETYFNKNIRFVLNKFQHKEEA